MSRILVVDDDPAMRSLLSFRVENLGHKVDVCESGEEVQVLLKKEFLYDIILLDVMLPGVSGADLLKEIKKEHSDCEIIIMTAYPSLKIGVSAIKDGAYDFIVKPFDIDQLLQIIKNATQNQALKEENQVLRQTFHQPTGISDLIGKSSQIDEVRQLIRQSANSRATVLINGESGTGKEVVAKTIHKNSVLHKEPFVVVNCGAIPENLVESELFGHEKGSFTGANQQHKGKFEQARKGTLFLDEVGELSLTAQVKLLRVLQEKEITRVGGTEPIKLNNRVIAATNRNLATAIRKGTFREDLYYRLALFVMKLPALDERGDDKILLARYFLEKHKKIEGIDQLKFSRSTEKFIKQNRWPGNVRELDNCIHRTVLMNPDKQVL
ncbi:MAG: sigma-54-dependent Fis family transcriptional regulator, partial [Proteobacteria bacterium]|nr:sigma-54-dependent Fis family transcriptional regulator [Pseudomonadota bacterium]